MHGNENMLPFCWIFGASDSLSEPLVSDSKCMMAVPVACN